MYCYGNFIKYLVPKALHVRTWPILEVCRWLLLSVHVCLLRGGSWEPAPNCIDCFQCPELGNQPSLENLWFLGTKDKLRCLALATLPGNHSEFGAGSQEPAPTWFPRTRSKFRCGSQELQPSSDMVPKNYIGVNKNHPESSRWFSRTASKQAHRPLPGKSDKVEPKVYRFNG